MIRVEKIIPGGMGLATGEDGKKVFLWNALPGEVVEKYRIIKNKKNYIEAVATKLGKRSEFRVEPKDECFLATSPWQIMNFEYENQQKCELVKELFREHQINIELPEIMTDGKEYCYRNKMEYALYYDKDLREIRPAFHTRGSHQKIPVGKSSIERLEIWQRANEIINDLNRNGEEARKYQSLLLRCNQAGEVSGGLYENHQPHPRFETLEDEILGHKYTYSPNGFFQINLPVYEMALKEIKKHIVTDKVLDLYAGVGTIGLSIARDKNLKLVECDKAAYGELKNNAGDGHETLLAKSEEVLNYIEPEQTVIVDPPRAGCDKKLIKKFLEVEPEKIIYLSCNPATQARDVSLLCAKYQMEMIKTFNFFPHTPHIENLVILRRS